MPTLTQRAHAVMSQPFKMSQATGYSLYPYQMEPFAAIRHSVKNNLGHTIVIVISRQAGKDELLAHLKVYYLSVARRHDLEIVEFNPTYKPQTIRAIDRLERRLSSNAFTRGWKKRSDFMRDLGLARVSFLSGDGRANVVGATASIALIVNEAQDIKPAVYDAKASPMAAAKNATRVIVGTVWTSNTLLAREMRLARQAEEADGITRLFLYTADDVRKHNDLYGKFVDAEIKRLGREHPFIKTQYFCEEIDAQAGMFNDARRALMLADRPGHERPQPKTPYAFLVDVAGQDENRMDPDNLELLSNTGRDSTTLSIASIDGSSIEALQLPTYRIEKRLQWTGDNHLVIFGQIKALAEIWKPQYIIVDATGVGEGLWALLARAFPNQTIAVKFTASSKSEIGYLFLACIETGRFRDCAPSDEVTEQYMHVTSEILIGPQKTMRWSVPEGTRSQATGKLIHDDFVLADSLITELDKLNWFIPQESTIIPRDMQREIDGSY